MIHHASGGAPEVGLGVVRWKLSRDSLGRCLVARTYEDGHAIGNIANVKVVGMK